MIETVLKKIEDLGMTLIHEHLTIDLSEFKDDDANLNDFDAILEDLKEIKSRGIDTIVDVTNRGMGRNIELMKKYSQSSGINVITSTGYYVAPFLPKEVFINDVHNLENILINEILHGIDGTGVKASIIGEIGSSIEGFTTEEKKVFEAAAKAHYETGKAIYTHTSLGKHGLEQANLLKKFGVDLSKVIIGHVDLNPNLEYYLKLLDMGCNLGFDTIGKESYMSDKVRIEYLSELMDRGYENQIFLSNDISRKSYLKKYKGFGHEHIFNFLEKLSDNYISPKKIEVIMKNNPQALLK